MYGVRPGFQKGKDQRDGSGHTNRCLECMQIRGGATKMAAEARAWGSQIDILENHSGGRTEAGHGQPYGHY